MTITQMKRLNWVQRSQRGRMSPFPNVLSCVVFTKDMADVIDIVFPRALEIFHKRDMWWFGDKNELKAYIKKAREKITQEPSLVGKLVRSIKVVGHQFVQKTRLDSERNLVRLSDNQLAQIMLEYEQGYQGIYKLYAVAITLDFFFPDFLRDRLSCRGIGEVELPTLFDALTRCPAAMLATNERIDLYHAARRLGQRPSQTKFNRAVTCHLKKWWWLTRDYEDPIQTNATVRAKLIRILSDKKEQQQARILEKEMRAAPRRRAHAIKKCALTRYEQNLFGAMRDAQELKEVRKMFVSQSLEYLDRVLLEIMRRTDLSLYEVRHVGPGEWSDVLRRPAHWRKILKARYQCSLWFVDRGQVTVITGKSAQKYLEKLTKPEDGISEIKGVAASPGVARGPARIILHPEDCAKLRRGEVMVTVQAVPSFSDAVHRAAALTADGGTGITSHPATLAREAGIPCVTGLRVGTKVFKDGDLVEVDGNKGIVRKIK